MKKLANNKKGFSLIELIIVIAIMVALIAVMAPNFVKYVQKSRDTALSTAAEDFLSTVKVAFGDPESTLAIPAANSTITFELAKDGKLCIKSTGIPQADLQAIVDASGADMAKVMQKSEYKFTITIKAGPTFSMETATAGGWNETTGGVTGTSA